MLQAWNSFQIGLKAANLKSTNSIFSCKNTFGVKRCGKIKQTHIWKWIQEQIGDNKISYQNTAKGQHTKYINTTVDTLYNCSQLAIQLLFSKFIWTIQQICFQPLLQISYIEKFTKEHGSQSYFSFGCLFINIYVMMF